MHPIALRILGLSALLTAVSVVVPLARRVKLPYTLVLGGIGVLIGLAGYLKLDASGFGADLVDGLRDLGLLDNAFVDVYLPPLLFSAGLTVDIRHIVEDVGHVLALALVAVLGCTVVVGFGLSFSSGLALLPCLLLGTVVSTTDTAAVVNIFREVGAPKRLSAIVEGEALFNDAAAIALFGLFMAMLTEGRQLDVLDAGRDFLLALCGGALFGYAAARFGCWLIAVLRDTVTTEVTLTIALTYFTFIVGNEVLHVSGVVATVTLAIVIGAVGRTRVSPGSWEVLHRIWEHLDFWATCLIFVTSATFVPKALTEFGGQDFINVGVVFAAALASRAAVIWGMMPTFSALGASKPLSQGYKTVLWWGGMRGAVTIALALATAANEKLPADVRHVVLASAIGYVIASLVLNGLTLRPLMGFLRLDRLSEHDRVLRNRVLALARTRIRRELDEVAGRIGQNAGALSRTIVPRDQGAKIEVSQAEQVRMALETWCHHEHELVLSYRERGVFSRHHADLFRVQSDRLLNELRAHDVAGYRLEAKKLLRPPRALRAALWLFRHAGIRRPLVAAIADWMERLIGELLMLHELSDEAERTGRRLFRKEVGAVLRQLLDERRAEVATQIAAIEEAYPAFAQQMHRRHLAVVAVGLVEAEYRRHLTEATISADVFDDLEGQRRAIAQTFSRRPSLDLAFNVERAVKRYPKLAEIDAAHTGHRPLIRRRPGSLMRPYIAFPGQRISFPFAARRSVFIVLAGHVRAARGKHAFEFGPGDAFTPAESVGGCRRVTEAQSNGYATLLEIRNWPGGVDLQPRRDGATRERRAERASEAA